MAKALRQYVWDAPTRVFHWLLVALIGFSWWSAETYHMDWHLWSGIAVCGLVIFRVLWGVFGTETSRFRQFVTGPRTTLSYVRGSTIAPIGHNPLGAWSVVALLLVLATQVASGLFAVDTDGIESGPLSYLVDFDQGRVAAWIHHTSFTVLQALVVLHVVAIVFYLVVRRRNLTWTMIVGTQPVGEGALRDVKRVAWWRAAIAALVAAAVAWWIAYGAPV